MDILRHFIDIDDISSDELYEVLNLSEQENLNPILSNSTVALLFQKPSTRTRHSCEAAIAALGGHGVYTQPQEVGIDERESAQDIARTLSLYHKAIAARVFDHDVLTRMTTTSTKPIINLLSDHSHPIQTLADLLTIRQEFGSLKDKKVVYVGDPNNVAFSLAVGCSMVDAHFSVAHPDQYNFSKEHLKHFSDHNISIESQNDPYVAVKDADVIYTDAWYSMGQEQEAKIREPIFQPFQINDALMKNAPSNAIFMHCLPAHRNHEVTDSVLDGKQSRIWTQAQNRMHTIRGLLYFLSK